MHTNCSSCATRGVCGAAVGLPPHAIAAPNIAATNGDAVARRLFSVRIANLLSLETVESGNMRGGRVVHIGRNCQTLKPSPLSRPPHAPLSQCRFEGVAQSLERFAGVLAASFRVVQLNDLLEGLLPAASPCCHRERIGDGLHGTALIRINRAYAQS